ncbi:MAG TPA: hypothetical protein VFQ61_22050, partial [Polyangiaceae bacterium]|nr:hypothetical protein [Polyangiaceae bacterium]
MKQLRPVVPKRRRLPLPVSRVLADPLDERAINKMWRTIERRRGQPVHPIGKWILVLACIGSLGVLASVLMPRNQPQPLAAANNVGAKANSSAQASLLSPIEVPPMAPPVDVTMADGSHI